MMSIYLWKTPKPHFVLRLSPHFEAESRASSEKVPRPQGKGDVSENEDAGMATKENTVKDVTLEGTVTSGDSDNKKAGMATKEGTEEGVTLEATVTSRDVTITEATHDECANPVDSQVTAAKEQSYCRSNIETPPTLPH